MRSVRLRIFSVFGLIMFALVVIFPIDIHASNAQQRQIMEMGIMNLNVDTCDNVIGGGSATTADIPFALPATSGRAGLEEAVLTDGSLVSNPGGPRVTFSGFAGLGQEYRDYYITMRWGYVAWNWNGTAASTPGGSEYLAWMKQAPRIVKVTNPDNGKSIYAAAIEAGPAPWTGVDRSSNNDPKQGWTNPQVGTPSGYTGRVSGFPPVAFNYLGIQQGMSDGSGTILQYEWAADQSVKPGPADGAGANAGFSDACGGGSGSLNVSLDGVNANDLPNPPGKIWSDGAVKGGKTIYLSTQTLAVARIINHFFSDKISVSTYAGGSTGTSCHGNWGGGDISALDLMVKGNIHDRTVRNEIEAIANWIVDNRDTLDVTTIIYYDKVLTANSPSRPYSQWSSYRHSSGSNSDNLAHRNHIHISISPCKG